jgi:hypothetical protein
VTKADVAELVDARDLKSGGSLEDPQLYWKTQGDLTIESDGSRWNLENRLPVTATTAARAHRHMPDRPTKIALAEMRASGVRGVLVYCGNYRCSHWSTTNVDQWPDDLRLSDLEPRFTCKACGRKGADVRPNFQAGA